MVNIKDKPAKRTAVKVKNWLFFPTTTHVKLAERLALNAGWQVGKCQLGRYADGEVWVRITESVKGREVIVWGSTQPSVENWWELLMLLNALKVWGAKKVTAVIPYFGYARADRLLPSGEVANAEWVVKLLTISGADQVVAVDLHSPKVAEWFKIPVIQVSAVSALARSFKDWQVGKLKAKLSSESSALARFGQHLAVAAPDQGAVIKAKELAKLLGITEIVTMEKTRLQPDQVVMSKLTGKVKGKQVVIVDDMIQTGETLLTAAELLKSKGATDIYVCATHMIYAAGGWEKLIKSQQIKHIFVTDTVPPPAPLPPKITLVPIADLITEKLRTSW